MNIVLYTHDGMPITVIDVPIELYRNLDEWVGRRYNVPLPYPARELLLTPFGPPTIPKPECPYVELRVERLEWFDRSLPLLIADDEEGALALQSVFLPGQRREVQREREDAKAEFALGLMRAMRDDRA